VSGVPLLINGYEGPMSTKAARAFASGRVHISPPSGPRAADRSFLLGALAMAFLLLLGLSGAFVWFRMRGGASAVSPQVPGSSMPAAIGHGPTDAPASSVAVGR
jgi:hypothetical protein